MDCNLSLGRFGIPYSRGGKIVFYCITEAQLRQILCHGLSPHGVNPNGGFYGGKESEVQGKGVAIGYGAKVLQMVDGVPIKALQFGEGVNSEDNTAKFFDWRFLKPDGKIDDERLPHFKIELKAENGYIQWRYVGTDEWFNLISIDALQGADGQSIEIAEETEIDELKIVEIQNNISDGIYIVLVPPGGDNRSNQTVPEGINGDVSGHIISYNGDTEEWNDYGAFSGIPGTDGKQVELRNTGTYIQWKYDTDASWVNLISVAAITGPQGPVGPAGATPIFQIDGDYIQYSINDGSTWNNLVHLSLITGPAGEPGEDGTDAAEIELRVSSNLLQWRRITSPASTWNTLYDISSLQGVDGRNPEYRLSGGYIQWRLVGDPTWINLVPLTSITGPQGIQGLQGDKGDKGDTGNPGINGTDGRDPEFRVQGGWLQWRYVGGTTWTSLIFLETSGGGGGNTVIFSASTPSTTNELGTVWINLIGNEYRLVPNELGNPIWVQTGPFAGLQEFIDIIINSVVHQPIVEGVGNITVDASGGIGTLYYTLLPSNITNTTGIFAITEAGTYTVRVNQANNYNTQETDPINITSVEQEDWYELFNFVGIEVGSTTLKNDIVGKEDIQVSDNDISGLSSIPNTSNIKLDIGGILYDYNSLVNKDYSNILVKYGIEAPHTITRIGILKSENINNLTQEELDLIHEEFDLWIWWGKEEVAYTEQSEVSNIQPEFIVYENGAFVVDRIWNDNGLMKENRPLMLPPEFEDPNYELTEFTFEDNGDNYIANKVGETWNIEKVIVPVSAEFSITYLSEEGASDGSITVFNETGATDYEYTNDDGVNWQSSPEFIDLPAGTYTLRIRDANETTNDVLLGVIEMSHGVSMLSNETLIGNNTLISN